MKKSEIYNKANAEAVQAAIKRRFGGMAGVDIADAEGFIRIKEKAPARAEMHVKADFCEREQDGEKLTGLSFSSETPIMRYGEAEVLLHESGAADFSRLMNVGAILKNHDPSQIVGVPVKAWIDEQKRGNLAMRWGTTETALQAKKEALEDKTLRGVSVGYSVREWVYLKNASETYKGISGPAWVAVKWDALEASLTPIPADPSVGLERSVKVIRQANAVNKTQEETTMKKVKLLRAWKASSGKSYDAGAVLEVDERTFAELTEGDTPMAEAAQETEQRAETPPVIQTPAPAATPAPTPAQDYRELARAAIREEMRKEAQRAAGIRAMCRRFGLEGEFADSLVDGGKTMEEAQRAVMDKMAEQSRAQTPGNGAITIMKDGRDSTREAAIDGLMLRSGVVQVEKPAPGASEFRGMTLLDVAKECLRKAGLKTTGDVREVVARALNMRGAETIAGTTSDFPLILAATANKSLLAGYEVAPATYQFWARTGSLNDFKPATRLKFGDVGKLKLVPEGQKYTETKRTEKKETIQLGTYARKWTMSRQAVINDDLGAFTNTMFGFGVEARMLPNDLAIAVLTANAAMTDGFALFSSEHGNLDAETDRRLDTLAHATAALAHMIKLMGAQKQYQHPEEAETARYLNLRAKIWLVSMTDWLLARQVINSATDAGQTNAGVVNPFANLGITVVPEQNIATSSTDYSHYLFADPRLAPVVEVAFLQGNQQPYQEEMDQTDADGRVWLCRLDCGAAAVDHVGAVKATGADA
jgi:hypothetical protein